MMNHFEVGGARVFLEGEKFTSMSSYQIENLYNRSAIPWLCQAADRALGLAGALTRYVEAHSHPPLEAVFSFDLRERIDFYDKKAESPWDACFIDGESIHFPDGFVHLLVEYLVRNVVRLNEDERKYIYLECKRKFSDYLSHVKIEYPELAEDQALQKTLLEISVPFKKKYGVTYDVFTDILREGYQNWRGLACPADAPGNISPPHQSRVLRINEVFRSADDAWIHAAVEGHMNAQKQKARNSGYTPIVVKHKLPGVEDAIDVEYEMRMEEIRKNRKNGGSL